MDALDTSDAQMKALFDRSGEQKAPPRTAGAKVRPNNKRSAVPKHNSLNLHAAKSHGSQKQMQQADKQNQNILLGRLEGNKFVTQQDDRNDAVRQDESKRRDRLEEVNYKLFSEELVQNQGGDSGMGHHRMDM